MTHTAVPEQAVETLRRVLSRAEPWLTEIIQSREEVLARYQPMFTRERLPELTAEEFRGFLLLRNNRHWALHRQGSRMCADMPRLREALSTLLDESQPIEGRMDSPVPHGMGRGAMTAVLLVVYPDRYGVWNNTSEQALKALELWPQFNRGESFGSRYVKVNAVLLRLAQALDVDLWTLDAAFWGIAGRPDEGEPAEALPEDQRAEDQPVDRQAFRLERHLHEFLRDNWERTSLGQEWELYGDPGADEPGFQYPCGVGIIDLLAKHRTEPAWLVVELKRGQGSDETVGQVLRYMGWVRLHLAEPGDRVQGLVIAHESDTRLRYALAAVAGVDMMLYEVHFSLRVPPGLGEEGQE